MSGVMFYILYSQLWLVPDYTLLEVGSSHLDSTPHKQFVEVIPFLSVNFDSLDFDTGNVSLISVPLCNSTRERMKCN